jgi:NitT/TauT family transport system ATP-binding protein
MPPATALQTSPSLLALHDVSKIFPNGTEALANLNFNVHRGEFLSLLGPSGCGKSTVLRIIASLIAPSHGSVEWPDPSMHGGKSNRIGFVFQDPTLMPWASIFNNVSLPLVLKGVAAASIAPRVTAALERVGLSTFAHAYPRELSGGMRMRVSIARALVTEPELLLMDEPFAALDEITRFALNDDLLRMWQALRTTIVFVTHSVFESVYLSSRIAVMSPRPGRVVTERAVEAPYPRGNDFRTSADYAALCRRTSDALARAMAGGSP